MEAACGEYGDIVPKLVTAVKNGLCASLQAAAINTNAVKINKELNIDLLPIGVNESTGEAAGIDFEKMMELKESAILDNNYQIEDELMTLNGHGVKMTTLSGECVDATPVGNRQVRDGNYFLDLIVSVITN